MRFAPKSVMVFVATENSSENVSVLLLYGHWVSCRHEAGSPRSVYIPVLSSFCIPITRHPTQTIMLLGHSSRLKRLKSNILPRQSFWHMHV